ncbi:membrane dipeptidase [candidate division WOR-3 bacterium]|nr:membrane dipeptidase [candidate division WOR-3 bacterium]
MTPKQLHFSSLVVDMHCDTILAHISGKRDITRRSRFGHLDLPRLVLGGVRAQVFALFPDPKRLKPGEFDRFVLNGCRLIKQICAQNRNQVGLALSPYGLKRIVRSGRTAIVIGVEGGHALEGDLSRLKRWFRAGVRVLTLTWCNSNELGDASWDKNRPHQGLSELGKRAVRLMNRLGMIVDVSHSAERTFYQAVELSVAPVIASHSGVYALRRHNRNLKKGQLAILAQKGGVMGQVFLPAFLNPNPKRASVKDVLRAIDYVVQHFGPDVVGLGSDFDGFSGNLKGLEDGTRLPEITKGLVKMGYTEAEIKKVLGLNFVRVWEKVWAARAG